MFSGSKRRICCGDLRDVPSHTQRQMFFSIVSALAPLSERISPSNKGGMIAAPCEVAYCYLNCGSKAWDRDAKTIRRWLTVNKIQMAWALTADVHGKLHRRRQREQHQRVSLNKLRLVFFGLLAASDCATG